MSDEPIEWHDLGTVTFREFDDGDRTMARPKFGQIRYFERQLRDIAKGLQDDISKLSAEFDEARADNDTDRMHKLNVELSELNNWGIVDRFIPWYREVFTQLSEPLPDDTDEWPGYFMDASLATRILNQWKMRPKASGATPAP